MKKVKFVSEGEKEISAAIIEGFLHHLQQSLESDCIIVGAGPSGLTAAKYLSDYGVKVVLIERNNYLGGGFWSGGCFMNTVTFRAPAHLILEEVGISYSSYKKDLYISSAPLACATLVASSLKAGTRVLNLTALEDLVLKKNRVCGVVINWSALDYMPAPIRCLDPLALETKIVIDASGHEAYAVKKLSQRRLMSLEGEAAMWIEKSEDLVVEKTSEVYPGLFVCGMSVAAVFGIPRMGPTFGAMLASGKKVAELVKKKLQRKDK